MRSKRQHINTITVAGSELELYLCNRVTVGGWDYPAFQRDNVVEFDRRLPMETLARLGAALACREFVEAYGGPRSDGPLLPLPVVHVGDEPYAVRMVPKCLANNGVICYRACMDSRELLVAKYTRSRAVLWGIGAAETGWMWWQKYGDGKDVEAPPFVAKHERPEPLAGERPLPESVDVGGKRYAVRLACGRLFVRADGGPAEEVSYLRDDDGREIVIPGTVPPPWRAFVVQCAAAEGAGQWRKAA